MSKKKIAQIGLVPKTLEINSTEGFAQDKLNREPFGEAMRNIILNTSGNLVISLDGGWGSGKTTFLRMWQGLLKESDVASIYIDAFKKDYTEDAFISIAGAVIDYAEQATKNKEVPKAKVKNFINSVVNVGVEIAEWGMLRGVEAITRGIINEENLEKLDNNIKNAEDNRLTPVAQMVREKLTSQKKEADAIESMRSLLSDLPTFLENNKSNKLVIIIDELDRCKPSFAVEIIEKIKHLFSVENIVFVLGVNQKQLEASIKHIYGAEIDARTYLRKFVNLELALPKTSSVKKQSEYKLSRYIVGLLQNHFSADDRELITPAIELLGENFSCSLRDLERVVTYIILLAVEPYKKDFDQLAEKQVLQLGCLTFISFLMVKKKELLENKIQADLDYQSFKEVVRELFDHVFWDKMQRAQEEHRWDFRKVSENIWSKSYKSLKFLVDKEAFSPVNSFLYECKLALTSLV